MSTTPSPVPGRSARAAAFHALPHSAGIPSDERLIRARVLAWRAAQKRTQRAAQKRARRAVEKDTYPDQGLDGMTEAERGEIEARTALVRLASRLTGPEFAKSTDPLAILEARARGLEAEERRTAMAREAARQREMVRAAHAQKEVRP